MNRSANMVSEMRGDLNEFSDDEATPLTEPIYSGSQRSYMETKGWDVFRDLPPELDSGSEALNKKCLDITIKILKVLAYLVTFAIVLLGCVVGKGIILFMTSQIQPKKKSLYCNKELERNNNYSVEISSVEQVAWIWCLFFAFIVPELGTLFRSVRICIFKTSKKVSFSDFSVIWMFETMHILGLSLFVFIVLPSLDVIKGAMLTNCVAFIPSVLALTSRNKSDSRRIIKTIIDILAMISQLTGFIVWPIIEHGNLTSWLIPASLFLISAGWWENYVDRRSPFGLIRQLGRIKERLKKNRYYTYSFMSLWKMILFFAGMMLSLKLNGTDPLPVLTHFFEAFRPRSLNVTQIHYQGNNGHLIPEGPGLLDELIQIRTVSTAPLLALAIQISCVYLAYAFGKFACKICIQEFAFAFPVNLTVPVIISLLIASCGFFNEDSCWFRDTIPEYLFFSCPGGGNRDFLNDFITTEYAWVWLLWLLSQTWISIHIWIPACERLSPTEKLFVTPMYSSLFIDQSLCLNRRRDDEGEVKTEELELDRVGLDDNDISQYYETISIHTESSNSASKNKTSDSITRIFACATMWHETKSEMMEMMKSLFRMDEDQSARRVAQKYLKVVDADYYEFETHIYFDDAFEISDVCDDWMQVNQFVEMFVQCVDEAASYVHRTTIRLRPPIKIPTPYGGRLVYTLPGKTKMLVHLKDKMKIRHKKRWSQCMYMYYLLGHRLMELPLNADRKDVLAENTYILALDGDIDFQPPAVSLLVDLMKKNRNLGAACGRIHPVGSGPMVWYQLFEYAIGHWLQKATEHMIGCVMCSPGCFSLFRAKALMDDNVMRKYTTKSEEPRHYVQYDQGEDRWLCTLLLQRGYRVEYSAASDAYTHCPEGFNEFFNQRRRWVPSTIANIFDLLMDYKRTVKINDNISLPYIFYQIMLIGGTIIGPGTIFLMLVGAFVAAFRISNWISFYYNLIPIGVYTFVCMSCKPNWQLVLSAVLSTYYALVMMAVIVGTALQLGEDGVGSPSAMFLISMCGSFLIAAFIHPQEFWCIVPGLIYLLCIPSMYLLLIIYSIANLNVVSWGTREVAVKKTKKELQEEKLNEGGSKGRTDGTFSNSKTSNSFLTSLLGNPGGEEEEGGISFSIGNVLSLMLFTHKKDNKERETLLRIAESLEALNSRLDKMEEGKSDGTKGRRKSSRVSGRDQLHVSSDLEIDTDTTENEHIESPQEDLSRDDLINPYWIEDKRVGKGEIDYLSGHEISFWNDLIDKYLKPLDSDKQKQALMAQGLKELRNKSIFFFAMFNALFVLIVFMLTLHKDTLHIDWPFGVKENITITEDDQVIITKEYLHLEPIGIVLVFFFFAIILIQFIAMLFHRFGTISHILASTDLTGWTKKEDALSEEALIKKNAVEIVRQMQKLRGLDGDYDHDNDSNDRLDNRRTIHLLEKNRHKKRAVGTLDVAFKKRFFALNAGMSGGGNGDSDQVSPGKNHQTPILGHKLPMRRETLKALEHCRDTVITERKQSKMRTLGASNSYNTTKDKHRSNTKLTSDTVGTIFTKASEGNPFENGAQTSSSATDEEGTSSISRKSNRLSSWKPEGALVPNLTENSSSGTSKM